MATSLPTHVYASEPKSKRRICWRRGGGVERWLRFLVGGWVVVTHFTAFSPFSTPLNHQSTPLLFCISFLSLLPYFNPPPPRAQPLAPPSFPPPPCSTPFPPCSTPLLPPPPPQWVVKCSGLEQLLCIQQQVPAYQNRRFGAGRSDWLK